MADTLTRVLNPPARAHWIVGPGGSCVESEDVFLLTSTRIPVPPVSAKGRYVCALTIELLEKP